MKTKLVLEDADIREALVKYCAGQGYQVKLEDIKLKLADDDYGDDDLGEIEAVVDAEKVTQSSNHNFSGQYSR